MFVPVGTKKLVPSTEKVYPPEPPLPVTVMVPSLAELHVIFVGLLPVATGSGFTVKDEALVPVPAGVMTLITPVVAEYGTVAVI